MKNVPSSIAKSILFALIFIYIFGLFSVKVWDPDFWWHLKTGEHIWQTGAIPTQDPFAFTSLAKDPIHPDSKRISFILAQYWLAQVILYLVYKAFSFQGIIAFRAALLTLVIFMIWRGVRREGIGFFPSLPFLIPAVIVLTNFTGERPQLFSFVFSFLLVYLLDGFRKSSLPAEATMLHSNRRMLLHLIPVPVLMALWANIHGGFILGIIIICLYLLAETIKFLTGRFGPLPRKAFLLIVAAGAIAIPASFINPNGFNVIPVLMELEKSRYRGMIVEAMSPVYLMNTGFYNQELIAYFTLLILGVVFFIVNIRALDITDALVFAGLSAMSLSAARVIPFFIPVAIVLIAKYLSLSWKRVSLTSIGKNLLTYLEKPITFMKSSYAVIMLSSVLSIVLLVVLINSSLFRSGIRKERYPEGAVKFLKENKLPGNMFNPYVWGGYLIWGLYPDYKVFIDGRGLIEEVYFQEVRITGADISSFGGMPAWKAMLKAYEINFIITFSVSEFSGKLSPFIPALLYDQEWQLVYMDNNSLIFIKNIPENSEIINRFGMPKEWLWSEVITEARIKMRNIPWNSNFHVTIGDAFYQKGSYMNAKSYYEKALSLDPRNTTAQEQLQLLNSYGW
jgi:hypothetical protein